MRASDASCPFCGARVPEITAAPPLRLAGLGRAAIMAIGATVAAGAIVGCDGDDASPDAGPVAVDAAYGAPPYDAGFDAGLPAPAYGTPPFDAGQ